MKRILTIGAIAGAVLLMNGCQSPYSYVPVPQSATQYFTANIVPVGNYTYDSLELTINNKTGKDIEIDWNRTLFIQNGATNGTFMYQGVVYKDRNNHKAPDIVFANSVFKKIIYPNNLVSFYKSWSHGTISAGRVGILLNTKVDGKEIKRKIYVDIKRK